MKKKSNCLPYFETNYNGLLNEYQEINISLIDKNNSTVFTNCNPMKKKDYTKFKQFKKLFKLKERIKALEFEVFDRDVLIPQQQVFEPLYTEDDLVDFAKYLFSKERQKWIYNNLADDPRTNDQKLKTITEQDIEIWAKKRFPQ